MNNIVTVYGHHVPIPALPRDRKSEILFINEKKENAFWNRDALIKEYRQIWFDFIPYYTKLDQQATLYDQDGVLISLNKDDSDYVRRIYEQEMKRRRDGVYFNNGGDVTWLTGDHYFVLMWCKTQRHDGRGEYFDYREFQAHYFYLIYLVWFYDYILGLFVSKAKKTGITNLFWLYYLNRATMRKNRNYGYMSIDHPLAAKTWQDYFLYAYNGLIPALKPEIKNKSEVDGTIKFGRAYNKSKKLLHSAYNSEAEINSSVFCVPTKDKAFDVAVMNDIAFDEPTKYKAPFADIWRTNKESVKIQSKFNGRAWLFNYTPEEDSDSFRQAREVFMDSELSTITPTSNNQTKSGLLCAHIPAYASWEGAFNKNGICDEKKAMKEIQFERDKVKGDNRAAQAIKRQYANDKREAWGSAGKGSVFDLERLQELLDDIEMEQHNAVVNDYVEGNLEWERPLWNIGLKSKRHKGEFCNVKFVPLTPRQMEAGKRAKFRMYHAIPVPHQNLALKNGRDEWGCLLPPERFLYAIGGDPTNYAAGSEVIQGSKNGGYVMSMPDERKDSFERRVGSKLIVLEYFDRPELPHEAYEDYLMMIIYTGALSLIEGNAPYVATRLMEEGLGYYMLVRDKNAVITTWKRYMGLANESEKEYQLIRMTSNSANNRELLEAIVRVIKNYIDRARDGEKDYGKTIRAERLLRQLMDFDPDNTKLFDLVMSFGYTVLTVELYLDMLLTEVSENNNPNLIGQVLEALLVSDDD